MEVLDYLLLFSVWFLELDFLTAMLAAAVCCLFSGGTQPIIYLLSQKYLPLL